ncbi:MAG: cell division protein FtsI (penicillin-binding protein 3) [Flavobacteriales bacterium]|jgi:cell division protein FtsI (penicillin-binding protein 3)
MKTYFSTGLWRFWLIVLFFSALPILLVWKTGGLLLNASDSSLDNPLKNEGEDRTVRPQVLVAYRGMIKDRNGELLAVSTPVKSLYVDPHFIREEQMPALAKSIGWELSSLKKKIKLYRSKRFMYLEQQMSPYEADKILAHKFAGVFAKTVYKRFYPAGEVSSHIVGITNIDDKGIEGIELAYDEWLKGVAGKKKVLKDRKQNIVKDLGLIQAPRAGKDMQLTIDLKLQYLAYKDLKEAILSRGAKSGSIVLLDAKSGEVLAMANHPSYNPNDRSDMKLIQMRNRAVTDVFEPGSTVKPFTAIAAMESGNYQPHNEINTSPGYIRVGKKMIADPVNYGVLDLAGVLKKSSQVGMTKIALNLQADDVRDVFYRGGLGQETGIGFPGEQSGVFPSRNRWTPVERATFAYGYGLSVNALQLAQSYLTLANNGKFVPISLVKSDNFIQGRQVYDINIAKKVVAMLKGVARKGGTATHAQIEAYPIAGKTGTAHKLDEGGGYADDKYVALFAGFAPADDPKIVAVVIVNEPPSTGDYSGGKAAAPIFAKIVEKALKVLNVVPANDAEFLSDLSKTEASKG